MGPIVGALIAAGLSAIFNTGSTIAANKYNSPKSQLKRLRKAGLPLAFMYQGRVNTQSDVPKLSIDPTLGTTQQRNLEQSAPVQAGQAAKLEEEVRALEATNDWMDQYIEAKKDGRSFKGTNRSFMLSAERSMKLTDIFIKEHEEKIKGIFANVEETLFNEGVQADVKRQELQKISQQIANMAQQLGLMKQLADIRSFQAQIETVLSEAMSSLPEFMQSVFGILYKFANR